MRMLFTSFDVWEEHHQSNSSDDLLQAISDRNLTEPDWHFLRKIPVDFELAPKIVIAAIADLQPDITICCGMAEKRSNLSLESNGKTIDEILHTKLPLESLLNETFSTDISHDAGNFVCNHLYYSVLKHFSQLNHQPQCLFIHVPVLHQSNLETILKDFSIVIQNLKFL